MSILNALNFKCELINIYVENIKKACGNYCRTYPECLYFNSEDVLAPCPILFLGRVVRLRVCIFSEEHLDTDVGELCVSNFEKVDNHEDTKALSNLKLKHFVEESPFKIAVFSGVFRKKERVVSEDSVFILGVDGKRLDIYLDRVELSVYGQLIKVIELKENKKEMLKDLKEIWK